MHDRVYAVRDEGSQVECVNWKGRLAVSLDSAAGSHKKKPIEPQRTMKQHTRLAYFRNLGRRKVPVFRGYDLGRGDQIHGPAIIEEPTTTIIIYPEMHAIVSENENYILRRRSK